MSNNKTYTTEDIRLYLEGKLSSADMHAMEEAALNDPFLADAIEGMRQFNDQEKFAVDTAELKKRLAERVSENKKPVVIPILWKAAAVLLIVITGVAIIIYTGETNTKEKSELAKAEEKSAPPIAPQKRESADSVPRPLSSDAGAGPARDVAEMSSANQAPVPKIPRSPSEAASRAARSPSVPADDTLAAPAPANVKSADMEESLAIEPPPATPDSDVVSKKLQGKVAGIVMDEVVVVGYGSAKNRTKASIAAGALQKRIEPDGGWIAFETYINNNKAPQHLDTTKTGTEKISFIINTDGRPSSIRILKSLSEAHDKEMIRLLEEGPSWKVVRGKKRTVTLEITF